MANKRELKKSINYIAGELFLECLVIRTFKKAEDTKTDEILADILNLQNEFLARTNHPQPGCVKAYYRKLHSDFAEAVDAIINKIQTL